MVGAADVDHFEGVAGGSPEEVMTVAVMTAGVILHVVVIAVATEGGHEDTHHIDCYEGAMQSVCNSIKHCLSECQKGALWISVSDSFHFCDSFVYYRWHSLDGIVLRAHFDEIKKGFNQGC